MTYDHNKRLAILSDSELDELYCIPQFTNEQREHYFDLNDAEKALVSSRNDPLTKAYLILFLGYFKYKPIVLSPTPRQINADLDFIRKKFRLAMRLPRKELDRPQRSRFYASILRVIGYERYAEKTHDMETFVVQVIARTAEPKEVFDRCIQHLSERRVAIPGYSTLQKIISSGIRCEERQLQQKLLHLLSDDDYAAMGKMAYAEDDKPLITLIKKLPKTFMPKDISQEIRVFHKVKGIFPVVCGAVQQLDVSEVNIQYYASLVKYYSITRLRELAKGPFALYLACYLYQRYYQIGDTLISAFIHHVRKIIADAKLHAKEKLHADLLNMNQKIKKASDLLNLYIDANIGGETPFATVRERAFSILPENQIPAIRDYLSDVESDVKRYEWDYYVEHHGQIKNSLRKIFLCQQFACVDDTMPLLRQINTSQEELNLSGSMQTFDARLITPKLKPYLMNESDIAGGVDLSKAEMLLYIRIKERVEGHRLFIHDSLSYRRFEDDLVDRDQVKGLLVSTPLPSLKRNVSDLVAEKAALLQEKLQEVSRRLSDGENLSVGFSDHNGRTKWTIRRSGKDSEITNDFYKKLNQTHIGDILEFAQRNTDFVSALRHVRLKNKQPPDLNSVIACVVANGTRYGIHNMASLCDLSYEQLRKTQKNHLRLETLHEANDLVSNAIAKLGIFPYYNIQDNVIHASSDGQKFESRLNTIRTRYSSKYLGRGKGLAAVSLSANHVPVNAKMMGLNEHESHHLYDLLHNNTSDIQPDIVSTDTHGANRVNFALLDLSGWKFAPRYATPGKILTELFTCEETEGDCIVKMRRRINEKSIVEGWDFVQQVMMTLQEKHTSQSTIVRKLSSCKGKNKVFQALIEYDRLIKSLYMLDYMDDEELRRYVHRALNRGEAYHQLQRRVEQVNGSKFRGGSDDEIDLWYESGRLICNCIVYFNSFLLSELLLGYEKRNLVDKIEIIKRCSPVAWTHINFNGSYSFTFSGTGLDIRRLVAQMMG